MHRGWRPPRNDLLLAGTVAVLALVEALSLHQHRLAGVTLFVPMALSLAWRTRQPFVPVLTTAAFMVASVVCGLSLNSAVSLVIVVVVAAYSVGAHLDIKSSLAALCVLLGGGAVSVVLDNRPVPSNLLFVAVVAVLPWGAGLAMRARQRYVTVLEERTRLLESEREARAEAAVAEERARIARELHDIVSHSLSVISLQAGGVRRLLDPGQEKERQALMTVERTARSAIEEMHHMLGLLRREGPGELSPTPGLAQLHDLADRSSAAGLDVELDVETSERPLSPGVELTVYRVVQEALTNVSRHSDARCATVTVRYGGRGVHVSVVDRGSTTGRGGGAGLGLQGMRERLGVYGGTLRAGPGPEGGFAVEAEIPYPLEPA